MKRVRNILLLGLFCVVLIGFISFAASSLPTSSQAAAPAVTVQNNLDVELLPEALERLSWSAVIAGALITLILMFLLNILGVAVGLTQVNPEYGEDSAEPKTLAIGGLIWVALSNLIALFVGGWLAAYFAGIPEPLDGLLHGIMVWAISGLATIILVLSGIGRFMNGIAGLIGSGLSLTGTVASGAAHATGDVAQAAGSTLNGIGSLGAQALSSLAHGVQNTANMTANGLSNVTDTAIENMPDVQNALAYQDLTRDDIRMQVMRTLRQAGIEPTEVRQQAQGAMQDIKDAARTAVRHPEHLDEIVTLAVQRVFRRGEDVANDLDREALMSVLRENSDMTDEQISQQIQQWEERFEQVKHQTRQARDVARQKAEELRQQAEEKAREAFEQMQAYAAKLQHEAETRVQETLHEAERTAREAAQTAVESFAKVAAAIAATMIIGAVAAGIGGYIGAPEDLPDIEVDSTTQALPEAETASFPGTDY